MRAAFDLLTSNLQHRIHIFCQQQALELTTSRRIQSFPNQHRPWHLCHRHSFDRRTQHRFFLFSFLWSRSLAHFFNQKFQMFRARATASTHNRNIILFHKFCQSFRKRFRLQWENSFPIHIHRQTSIRRTTHRNCGMFTQIANILAHMFRTCRTVHPNNINRHAFQNRQCRGNVSPQQHPSSYVHRNMTLQRKFDSCFFKSHLHTLNRSLHFQNVL